MARTSSREIRLAANAVVFEKANGPKDGILKALVVSKHGREKVTWLVPWIFDYYTKLGFSPDHKIHNIHALRRVSASSSLSSFFCYRGLAGPVQKHKRTQDWRAGPFRSSSTHGEPQIWGVSEAMSALGFPVRAGKIPSSNGMPRSRAETWIQARAAPGPERASRLRRGSPGLDSGPLGRPLFRRCAARSVPVLLLGANVALENRD